ncbi:MAG: MoxR family ATPase, partial [Nanoarchaeota archaeon]
MRARDLIEALNVAIQADVPAFIWGVAGIGKSAIIDQLGEKTGMPVVDLRLATQEVGDLTGVPYINPDTNTTHWAKPSWWLEEDKWILFLDEMNRATTEVLQAVFPLVRDRRLHTHKLPSGVRIIAAGNPPTKGYVTNVMDEALHTRFMHLKLDPNWEDFIHGTCDFISPNVLGYIAAAPNQLCNLKSDFDINSVTGATPRTWDMVDQIHTTLGDKANTNEGRMLLTICASGLVGSAHAHDY